MKLDIHSTSEKSLKLTWTSGAEHEREKEPLHAQLRIYAHTHTSAKTILEDHTCNPRECLRKVFIRYVREFIIHLDTETSQYQLSAARHV